MTSTPLDRGAEAVGELAAAAASESDDPKSGKRPSSTTIGIVAIIAMQVVMPWINNQEKAIERLEAAQNSDHQLLMETSADIREMRTDVNKIDGLADDVRLIKGIVSNLEANSRQTELRLSTLERETRPGPVRNN